MGCIRKVHPFVIEERKKKKKNRKRARGCQVKSFIEVVRFIFTVYRERERERERDAINEGE